MVVNNWIAANLIWITLVITIIVLIYFVFTTIQATRKKRRFVSQLNIILLILGLMFLIFLTYHANEIEGKDWGQIILMLGLVIVTAVYASYIEKQAEASVKMAEVASRPYIIQTAVFNSTTSGSPPDLDYFDIYNAGNGPAIEVEISVFDKEKKRRSSEKRSFLRGSDSIKFRLDWDLTTYVGSTCYLVSEYRNIYSYGSQMWYQTWLPFQIGQIHGTNKIVVLPGNLEFREVSEKDRINAFSGSKPK